MVFRQMIFDLAICVVIFFLVLELVRKRKLREEYSWIWLISSALFFILVIKYEWLAALAKFIGAAHTTSVLFLGAFLFLLAINIQFSVRISKLTGQVKTVAQENALLKQELENLKESVGTD